jgi:hypothetical protein
MRLFSVYPRMQRMKFGLDVVHVGDGSESDESATQKPSATHDGWMKTLFTVSSCV